MAQDLNKVKQRSLHLGSAARVIGRGRVINCPPEQVPKVIANARGKINNLGSLLGTSHTNSSPGGLHLGRLGTNLEGFQDSER